jgi:hypothetical protein
MRKPKNSSAHHSAWLILIGRQSCVNGGTQDAWVAISGKRGRLRDLGDIVMRSGSADRSPHLRAAAATL